MRHSILDAIISLRPNTNWSLNGTKYEDLVWLDETETRPTKKEIEDEIHRLDLNFDIRKYQRDRKNEYPAITEQFDMLFWDKVNGTNIWQDTIQDIKNKYPKT